MAEKIALAPCNGMSANGLIGRVAVGDLNKSNPKIISICMGSTSADIEGENNNKLKKYPIITINGCTGACVNKILTNKGIPIKDTIAINEILDNKNIQANDAFRLDKTGEKCVEIIKKEIIKKL